MYMVAYGDDNDLGFNGIEVSLYWFTMVHI